jgi:uncharacterized damage-inducible protein DinB
MSPETLEQQLRICHSLVKANVGGVTHEESLQQPEPAGNCLNWVLGHLVATRSAFLRGLGGEPVWTQEECRPYDRHAPPIGDDSAATPLAEIWKAYDLSQERLLTAVAGLTPERLVAPVPAELRGGPAKTVGALLAFLGVHDAYHTGQTGVLRRLLGKPPADL